MPVSYTHLDVYKRQDILCAGTATGSIVLDVVGGNGPYSFNWSNGATSQNISNVIAGTYHVTVVDVNGCADVESGMLMQRCV